MPYSNRTFIGCASAFLICTSVNAQPKRTSQWGSFAGELELKPSGDGIHMKVLRQYSYKDQDNHALTALPGFETDGASIPRALWTVVGSPFTGLYLGAAVIHDVGCVSHEYSWQITHRMFYTAMLSLGVDVNYAKILYWGVRLGGPRWKQETFLATSITELKGKVEGAGHAMDNDKVKRENRSTPKTPNAQSVYTYNVETSLPSRALTDDEVTAISSYVKRRSPFIAGSVSLAEIDRRTPLDGPLPEGAIPTVQQ